MPDLIESAARNLAAWHETSVRALDVITEYWPPAWVTNGPIHFIYLSCITLAPLHDPRGRQKLSAEVAAYFAETTREVAICDCWDQLDLSRAGFTRALEPWLARPAGSVPRVTVPPDLEIVHVEDAATLRAFEETAAAGFEAPIPTPFTMHAPAILDDPRFHLWLGRVNGRGASVAMAYADEQVSGVYGVATVPGLRRRGYGEALTWQATLVNPDVPAVLNPSAMGASLYRRMGYRRFADFAFWVRPRRQAPRP